MTSARPSETMNRYLDAFTNGDFDAPYEYIAEGFVFRGPMLASEGKQAFIEGSSGLAPMVRGYTLLRQFEDGDEVCSIYDFHVETPAGVGSVKMTEWNVVRGGQLQSACLVFDTAAFAVLMPS